VHHKHSADVADGSNSEILPRNYIESAFAPIADSSRTIAGGPFRAKSGSRTSFDHFVGQRQHLGGTAIPSCFAVLRFTTNQNLLACSIGRSPGFAPLDNFWRHRALTPSGLGRKPAGDAGPDRGQARAGRILHFAAAPFGNTQRSDRLCLPMSVQRNLSHDMETYSSSTRVRGYACEHTRICAAHRPATLLPRWVSLLFESVRAGGWHAHPFGSMEPLDVALQKRGARAAGCMQECPSLHQPPPPRRLSTPASQHRQSRRARGQAAGMSCRLRVQKAKFSLRANSFAVASITDMQRLLRHVRNVPCADVRPDFNWKGAPKAMMGFR